MNIRYLYKNVSIDDRIKNYLENKLEKFKKLLPDILRVEVEIDKDKKGFFRVEIMIKTPRQLYRVEEISKDIRTSIDLAIDAIKIQIRRNKEKVWDKIIRKARKIKKRIVKK